MSQLWRVIRQSRLVVRLQLIVATSLLCLLVLGGLAVVESYYLMLDARVGKLRAISHVWSLRHLAEVSVEQQEPIASTKDRE
jgi:hypothetical protein